MRISEMVFNDTNKILGLAQFLIGRADDTLAKKKISTDSFINMLQGIGINMSKAQLIDLSQTDPLKNVIRSINDDEVIFAGGETPAPAMSADQAAKTVDQMAKRAAKKGL